MNLKLSAITAKRRQRRATFVGYGKGVYPLVGAHLDEAGSRWRITELMVEPLTDGYWQVFLETVEDPA